MIWQATDVRLSGGSGFPATYPYGSYEATWIVHPDDKDAAIAFLSDLDNFTGDLAIETPGDLVSDTTWEQEVSYQDFAGTYTLYHDPASTDDIYLTLTFDLLEE